MSVRRLAAAEVQPTGFAFSNDNASWAEATIRKYPEGRQQSAVIPLLMRAQEQEGWVTKAAIEAVANMLGMAYIRVLEVATFYTQFQLKPVGSRAHIQVCGTTPCMLRGSEELMDVCRSKIHHDQFHLNADGTLSWEEVECLGACVNAPMVMIFKDTYEDLTPERLGEIINAFEAGHGGEVPVGPQNGRFSSTPLSGQTSLLDEQALIAVVEERHKPAEAAASAPADAGQPVPPTQAAKPDTAAPETNAAIQSPSPVKADVAAEKGASAPSVTFDKAAANRSEPAVEGASKPRSRASADANGGVDAKAPELHKGTTVGANEKRAADRDEPSATAPSPDGKNVGNTGPDVGSPQSGGSDKTGAK